MWGYYYHKGGEQAQKQLQALLNRSKYASSFNFCLKEMKVWEGNGTLWAVDSNSWMHRSQQMIGQTKNADDRRDYCEPRTTSVFVASYAIWCTILCPSKPCFHLTLPGECEATDQGSWPCVTPTETCLFNSQKHIPKFLFRAALLYALPQRKCFRCLKCYWVWFQIWLA